MSPETRIFHNSQLLTWLLISTKGQLHWTDVIVVNEAHSSLELRHHSVGTLDVPMKKQTALVSRSFFCCNFNRKRETITSKSFKTLPNSYFFTMCLKILYHPGKTGKNLNFVVSSKSIYKICSSNTGAKTFNGGKESFQQTVLEQPEVHMQRNEGRASPFSHSAQKLTQMGHLTKISDWKP